MVRRTWPAELIGGLLSEGPRKWSELFNGLLLNPSLERLFCLRINVSYPLCSECDTSQGGRVARTQSSEVVKSLCLCGVKRLLNFCHAKQARITMLGRCLPNVKRWLLPTRKTTPRRSGARIVGDHGRDNHYWLAPRTDPDGRSLAHPVLIADK